MRRLTLLLVAAFVISAFCSEEHPPSGATIGIDLGTTHACVGVYKNGKIEIIANGIMPSYVAFSDGKRLIGETAKNQASRNPSNTIFGIKRLIGRDFADKEVQFDMERLPYTVIENGTRAHVQVTVKGEAKQFSPEEVSAMILVRMKQLAEDYLGEKVENAVITIPSFFNIAQRQSTRDAAAIAGLNVLRMISEPSAAALAYAFQTHQNTREYKNILVFKLGGAHLDVSVATLSNQHVVEMIVTHGDTNLGGLDFDRRIIEYMLKLHKTKTGKDCSNDLKAVAKLRREAERAKISLSTRKQEQVEVQPFCEGTNLDDTLSREKFEELNKDLFDRCIALLHKTMDDSGLSKNNIDEIVLVGGSTRIPRVQRMLKDFFGDRQPTTVIHPEEAVSYGATLEGIQLSVNTTGTRDYNYLLLEVYPHTLGIELVGGGMAKILPRNNWIPIKKSQTFAVETNQPTRHNHLLFDQTHATLGMATVKVYEGEYKQAASNRFLGRLDVEVQCDTPWLNKGPDAFRVQKRTVRDRKLYWLVGTPLLLLMPFLIFVAFANLKKEQSLPFWGICIITIVLAVIATEKNTAVVTENVTVTGAVVMGLSGRVEVSLELDAEGTLVVTAEDESSAGLPWNNKQEMVVTSGNRLSQESIHRMREQAEEFADEDARWREAAIALDEFESYVYGVKNALKDEGISAEISDHDRKIVLAEVKKAKAFVKENRALLKASKGEFEEAQRAMEKVVVPITSKLQRATLPSGDSSGKDGGRSDGKEEL